MNRCHFLKTFVLLLAVCAASRGAQPADPSVTIRIEAEDYATQKGSTAARYQMAGASGDFIVDNDWGGRATDFLTYRVELPAHLPQVHVALRYARAMPDDSVVRLELDGNAKHAVTVRLPNTGGWGFKADEWRLARAVLPAADKGRHTLTIRSTRDRNNVNLDRLVISDRPIGDAQAGTPPPAPVKANLEALRAAVRHLADACGARYARAGEFLSRLESLRKTDRAKVADEFTALQHEALVEANPLMAFGRLLFTRRRPLGGQHYAYTEALSWNRDRPRFWRPGASLCTIDPHKPDGGLTVLLDSATGVIRDPDVHWDGTRVLFSHKRNLDGDDFHLYELDAETRRIRQLTADDGFADYEGCYLPDGRIVFNSTRCVQTVDCFPVPASNLYVMDPRGGNIHRLTVNHVHDNFPTVLGDGRVVFTRWEYNDRWVLHVQGLAVMNPDGTATTALYGNNSFWPVSMLHARAIPGTTRVVCTLSGHHDVDQCGEMGIFDYARGGEETEGCLHLWPKRPITSTRNEFFWRRLDALYQYPYPLSERFFLVSCRPRGRRRFGIYLVDTFGNRVLVYEDPATSCSSPMPLAPRRRPPVIPPQVDYRKSEATVYMADVYYGPGLAGVQRGEVKALRIIEMLNRPTGTHHWAGMDGTPPMGLCSSWDAKRVIGTVPIAEDGSAVFTIPAGKAVYFQPLDASGRALQWMRSWVTAQPGETLSCVGCHESKREAPPQYPPRPRTGPVRPRPWLTDGRPFAFHADVQGVLDRACIRCHDHNHPKGIDLRGDKTDAFSLAYEHLRRYVKVPGTRQDPPMIPARSQGAVASPLILMLDKGHHDVKLTHEEMDRLVTWIDLNAPYYASYAITRYKANFGRCVVTDPKPLWTALGEKCFTCHKAASRPPGVPEGGFARFGKHKGRNFVWSGKGQYDTSNAVLVNLTHPGESRLLRAPLAKKAGGLGLHDPSPLATTDDPVYRAALEVIRTWADELGR